MTLAELASHGRSFISYKELQHFWLTQWLQESIGCIRRPLCLRSLQLEPSAWLWGKYRGGGPWSSWSDTPGLSYARATLCSIRSLQAWCFYATPLCITCSCRWSAYCFLWSTSYYYRWSIFRVTNVLYISYTILYIYAKAYKSMERWISPPDFCRNRFR